ncbi:hypothetical protein BU15DRAFT_79982 [Melanogaster broomeanus]|nr:hypothetical protein BU15DRAFT_79982 [Melanogaster broomeanus]
MGTLTLQELSLVFRSIGNHTDYNPTDNIPTALMNINSSLVATNAALAEMAISLDLSNQRMDAMLNGIITKLRDIDQR